MNELIQTNKQQPITDAENLYNNIHGANISVPKMMKPEFQDWNGKLGLFAEICNDNMTTSDVSLHRRQLTCEMIIANIFCILTKQKLRFDKLIGKT